jgi:lipopolysaccharide export system permease protein
MKKLTRYILVEHLTPFLASLFVIMFVFVLKFVSQYVGKIFAKGLDILTILELLYLNLAWMLALAVPMSVLVATLMAFGRMAGDNEITAIRSAGISLYKIIRPVLLAAFFIMIFMYYFNDQILPEFNHRARILMKNISRKKPTLDITEGVFNQFKNFDILTNKVKSRELKEAIQEEPRLKDFDIPVMKLDRLEDIIIVDRGSSKFQRTITARYGYVFFNKKIAKLVFVLFNGEIHESDILTFEEYRQIHYEQNIFYLNAKEFLLTREATASRGDREKNIRMLKSDIARKADEINIQRLKIKRDFKMFLSQVRNHIYRIKNMPESKADTDTSLVEVNIPMKLRLEGSRRVLGRELKQRMDRLEILERQIHAIKRIIAGYEVEVYKKLSIAFAAIVFVLVGAPLGIRTGKGSMGTSFALSFIFFIIYWVFLIQGEDLAERLIIHPFISMWAPNILIGGFGIYVTWRTVKEVREFNLGKVLKGMFRIFIKEKKHVQ